MKARFSLVGLAVVPFTLFMSFTPCTARPQHVRGHRHGDHIPHAGADRRSASSGSSLYIKTVGVTSSNDVLIVPTSAVAVNITLEPTVTSTPSIVPFFVHHATPGLLAPEASNVQQSFQSSVDNVYTGPYSQRQPVAGSTFAIFKPKATSIGDSTQDARMFEPSTNVDSATIHDKDKKAEAQLSQSDKFGVRTHSTSDAPSSVATKVRLMPRATSTISATGSPGDGGYQSFVLSSPSLTSSSMAASATAKSQCPARNSKSFTSSSGIEYTFVCNMDYADNLQPFYLVSSFAGCVQKCDAYNYDNGGVKCVAAIFVPGRVNGLDDCYLKSSLNNPVKPTGSVEGAFRVGFAKSSSSASSLASSRISTSSSSLSTVIQSTSASSNITATTSLTSSATASNDGVNYATGTSVVTPIAASSHLQGPAVNQPSSQYLNVQSKTGITLSQNLLVPGVNGDLSTGYALSPLTGVLQVNISTQSTLTPLKGTPHLSRDGGRGGYINGQHLFIFCDTGSYTTPTPSSNGNFLGFVSSSVAIDVGMNGLSGNALHLQDGIGEWSDDVGRMRGFAPLTTGELAYNEAMQGNGHRYAVWPESSLIPLDAQTSILYAPIVYDNVNMATRAAAFTYTGSTLLTVTGGGQGGPLAQRAVDKIFDQNEVEYGCAGGIRSWGPSGIGGADGKVYVFGVVSGGVLLGRTSPSSIANRNSYQYWDGTTWSSGMQTADSKAFFLSGPYMDIDVFYSPRHLTFIAVYLTIYADNTFYYCYLKTPSAILPPYAPGGDPNSDYVENLIKYPWSDQQVLYKASPGKSGKYIYSGGVQSRYYGTDDIYNGGSKMLISWTAPTGEDPASMDSEYQLFTAEIDWA